MTDRSLEGKVAVVTGGASGMGAATVALFAQAGALVVVTDVDVAKGEAVAAAAGARFVRQDVSRADEWDALRALVLGDYGRLDVMVNNAGIIVNNPIDQFDLELWHRVIGINLTGPVLGCHFAVEVMSANPGGPGGSIINVASTTAITAIPNDVGYVAAKGGVRSLSRSVAVLCARQGLGIRSNCIIPGAIDTGITERAAHVDPNVRDRLAKMSPLGRIGQPADIANAMLFLASDASSFVTGTDVLVDGGALALHPGY
jgi:3(or 17)beta-hydroxysteroid dehydrogenase